MLSGFEPKAALVCETAYPARYAHVIALGVKVLPNNFQTATSCNYSINTGKTDSDTNGIYCRIENSPKIRDKLKTVKRVRVDDSDSLDDLDEDLTETERALKIAYIQRRAERKKEQDQAVLEEERLEEVLRMCAEYEQYRDLENNLTQDLTEKNKDLKSCVVSKIKTNGSLTSPMHVRRFGEFLVHKLSDVYLSDADWDDGVTGHQTGEELRCCLANGFSLSGQENNSRRRTFLPSFYEFVDPPLAININISKSYKFGDIPIGSLPHGAPSRNTGSNSPCQSVVPKSPSPRNISKNGRRTFLPSVYEFVNTPGLTSFLSDSQTTAALVNSSPESLSPKISTEVTSSHIAKSSSPKAIPKLQCPANNVPTFLVAPPSATTSSSRPDVVPASRLISPSPVNAVSCGGKTLRDEEQTTPSGDRRENTQSQHRGAAVYGCWGMEHIQRLTKMRDDSMERISVLTQRLQDIEALQEKAIRELEAEEELLQQEYSTEMVKLDMDQDKLVSVKHQQMELLLDAARERADAQKKLDSEQKTLKSLRLKVQETQRSIVECRPPETDKLEELRKQLERETDQFDNHQRLFDDLEFSLLELETRHEEGREPLQTKLTQEQTQLTQSRLQREETLRCIEGQKLEVFTQVTADVTDLERERHLVLDACKKERAKIVSIDQQIQQIGSLPKSTDISTPHTSTPDQITTESSDGGGHGGADRAGPPNKTNLLDKLHGIEKQFLSRGGNEESKRLLHEIRKLCEGRLSRVDTLSSESSSSGREGVPEVDAVISTPGCLNGESESSSVASSEANSPGLDMLDNVNGQRLEDVDFHVKQHRPTPPDSSLLHTQCKEEASDESSCPSQSPCLSEASVQNDTNQNSLKQCKEDQDEIKLREQKKVHLRPMTRYLPFTDRHLDLRQFIESAGHSLDENTHVRVAKTTCRGYLAKMGNKFRLWARRWFVFDRTKRMVITYSDRSELRPRRCVHFQDIDDVFVDHLHTVKSPNPSLTFCLKTKERTYFLMAPNSETMRIWIDVLFTGAEGYLSFYMW